MTKLVLASGNKGKIAEFQRLLAPLHMQILPQSELGVEEVPETATTFIENAIIKARHAAEVTGLPALADDSGLEVDALDGAPGVYSARYAGPDASAQDNIHRLLHALEGVGEDKRSARFHCVLVYMRSPGDPTPLVCHGQWQGRILTEPRGDEGFGYDPVFWVPSHNCSAAELPAQVKAEMSHRGIAMAQLLKGLAERQC